MVALDVKNIYRNKQVRIDSLKEMDIPYGEEFLETHEESTFKNPDTIYSDLRLKKLYETIMTEAINEKATDIMIHSEENYGIVKFSIGKVSVPYRLIHKGAVESLMTYIRKLAETNPEKIKNPVSTKHRFTFVYDEEGNDGSNDKVKESFDTRIQLHPSLYGTSTTIRIFYNDTLDLLIDDLGFTDNVAFQYKQALQKNEGLIVLTGSTGSGKTTTEYVGIKQILSDTELSKNIYTIEDPIEYKIEGLNQSEINEVAGFGFAEGIRSFLRMNPDVVLVGEVRDKETADAVVRMSNSGHLVLTTIHANNTLEVLNVLKQYGIEESQIINGMNLVLYQTLQDKLCPHCKKPTLLKPNQKQWFDKKMLGKEEITVFYEHNPEGCEYCNTSSQPKGYIGKVMIVEMLVTDLDYRILKEKNKDNLDGLRKDLLNSQDNIYYPLEWDVHRRVVNGEITFDTATKLIH